MSDSNKKEKWLKLDDPKSGKPYYVEKYSKRKTWTKPEGKKITTVVRSSAKKSDSSASKRTWVKLRDKSTDQFYYVNAVTKKTTWTKPTDEGTRIIEGKIDPATNKCYIPADQLNTKKSSASSTSSSKTPIKSHSKEEKWETFVDPTTKRAYYVSSKDGRRTWSKPVPLEKISKRHPPGAAASKGTAIGPNWKCFVDASSKKEYYVNTITGEKTWHKPVLNPLGENDNSDSEPSRDISRDVSVSSRTSEVWAVDLNDLDRTLVKSLSEIKDFSVRALDKHLNKCFKGLKEGWSPFRVQKNVLAMLEIADRQEQPTNDYFADTKFIRLYVQFLGNERMVPAWESMLQVILSACRTPDTRDRVASERRVWDQLIVIIGEPVAKSEEEERVALALKVLASFVENDDFFSAMHRRNGFRALLKVGMCARATVRRLGIDILKRLICSDSEGASKLLRQLSWLDIISILKSNLYELIPSTLRALRDRVALGVLPLQKAILVPERSSWMWRKLGDDCKRVFLVMQDGILLEYAAEVEAGDSAPALRKIRLHGCSLQEKAVNISGSLQYGLDLGFRRSDDSNVQYLLASPDKHVTLAWANAIKEVLGSPRFSRPRRYEAAEDKPVAAAFAASDVASTFLNIDYSETFTLTEVAGDSSEGLELLLTLLDIVSIDHVNEVLSAKYSLAVLTLLIQGEHSEELRRRLLRLELVQRIVRLLRNIMTSVNTYVNVGPQSRTHLPLMEALLSICAQAICTLLMPHFASSAEATLQLSTRPMCRLLVNALDFKCLADDVSTMFILRTMNCIMTDNEVRNMMLESGLVTAFADLRISNSSGVDGDNNKTTACPSTYMHDFVSQNFCQQTLDLLQRDLASICSSFTSQILVRLPTPVLLLLVESDDDAVVLRSLEALTHIASSFSRPYLVIDICDRMPIIATVLRKTKTASAIVISTAVELVLSLTRHADLRPKIRQGDVIGSLTQVLENMDLHRKVHEMAAMSIRTLLFNEPEAQTEFLVEAQNGDCIFKLLKTIMSNYSSRAVEAIASVLENAAATSIKHSAKIGECSGVWSICNAIAKQSEGNREGDPQATTALCRALLSLVKRNTENRNRFLSNRGIYISLLHLLRSRRMNVVRAALTCVEHTFCSVEELRLLLHTQDATVNAESDNRKSVRKADKRAAAKPVGALDVMALLVMHNKSQDFSVRRLARGLLHRIGSSVDLLFALNLSLEHLLHLLRCTKLPHVLASTLSVLTERFEMGSMPPLCANLPLKEAVMNMHIGTQTVPVWICVQHCFCPDAEYVFMYIYENRHTPRFKFILHGTRAHMPEVQVTAGPKADDESTFSVVYASPTSFAKVVLKAASVLEAQQWTRFLRTVSASGVTLASLAAIDSGDNDALNAVDDASNVAEGQQTFSVIKQALSWEHLAAEATWSRLLSLMLPSQAALPPSVVHPLLQLFALLSSRFDLSPMPEKSKVDKQELEKLERISAQLRALGGNNVLTRRLYQCFHIMNDMIHAPAARAGDAGGLDLIPMPILPPPIDAEDLPPGLVTHARCTPPDNQQLTAALYRGFRAQVHLKQEPGAGADAVGQDAVLATVNNQAIPLYCSVNRMLKLMTEIPNEGNSAVLRFVRRFAPRAAVARACHEQVASSVCHARSLAMQTLANLSEPSHPSHDSVCTVMLSGGRLPLAEIVELIRVAGERIASVGKLKHVTNRQWRDSQTDHRLLKHSFRLIRNLCSGVSQYQLYSPSPKLALAVDHSAIGLPPVRARTRSRSADALRLANIAPVYSQQDTIQLFVEDVSFLTVALHALREISQRTHHLFEHALRREITVVLQTISHTTLPVRIRMVQSGALECLCDLRAEATRGTDVLWKRQTNQVLDTFCGKDNLCQNLSVPQLVLLLNTEVEAVVFRAASAIENIVHELEIDRIDEVLAQALTPLRNVIELCCKKAFSPPSASKIMNKLVSSLYGLALQPGYHDRLAAGGVHLLLTTVFSIPKLSEQIYIEAVLGMTVMLYDNQELQQQLVDPSVRPEGAPIIKNSLTVLCQTIGMNVAVCEKLAELMTQLATLQAFIDSDERTTVVKRLHALLQNTFGGIDKQTREPAYEKLCAALDVIFKTSNWKNFFSFTELFPLLMNLLDGAQTPGLQGRVCDVLRTTGDKRENNISAMRLSESGLTRIVKISSDSSHARRQRSAQLLLRHWINHEQESIVTCLHVEELCLLARCGSLEVVQAVARQLANKISWGLHQPVNSLLLPDKCGWLKRRSAHTWRKRWYVVINSHLYEYHGNSGSDGEQLQRKLMLAGCKIDAIVVKKRKAIQIVIPNFTERLILTTNDAGGETLNSWTKCLLEHITYANIHTGHVSRTPRSKRASLKRGLLGPRGVMLLNTQESEALTWSDFADTDRIPLVLGLIQSESLEVALQASRILSLLLPHAVSHDKAQVPKLAKHCAHGVMRFLDRGDAGLSRQDRGVCLRILARCRDQIPESSLMVPDTSGAEFNVLYPVATFSRVTAMPLDLSRTCMRCDTLFSRSLPAQNCASCGIVVCGFCNNSPVWAIVKHSMTQVCNHCYKQSSLIQLPSIEDYQKSAFAQMMALASPPVPIRSPEPEPEAHNQLEAKEEKDDELGAPPPPDNHDGDPEAPVLSVSV